MKFCYNVDEKEAEPMYVCKCCENILKKCMQLEYSYMHFLHAYIV